MEDKKIIELLKPKISVTRQNIILAKYFIQNRFTGSSKEIETTAIINEFLKYVEASMPAIMKIDSAIAEVAKSISYNLAACEAIWELVHNNLLIPHGVKLNFANKDIPYIEMMGSGCTSQGSFALYSSPFLVLVPEKIMFPPSRIYENEKQPLSDPDLYLHEIDIPNIDTEVKESLIEAVNCFRHELYMACLTMLGRASEGAWIELGCALAKISPKNNGGKLEEIFTDSYLGIGKKIIEVVKLYECPDLQKQIQEKSGVRLSELKQTSLWSDVVRDSRNSIHYGAEPKMSNSYEKVAALLIGAVPHLKLLYKIKNSADEILNLREGGNNT